MPGRALPLGSRTTPAASYSGISDSIIANTDSYSATSMYWPWPERARSCSASSAPITPYSAASESPIDTPTRTDDSPGWPDR